MHDGDINNYTKTWHNPSTLYRVDDQKVPESSCTALICLFASN